MTNNMITYACPPDSSLRNILGPINDRELLFSGQLIKECERVLDEHKLSFFSRLGQEIVAILDLCRRQVDYSQIKEIEDALAEITRFASLFGYAHIQNICERTGALIQSEKFHDLPDKKKFDLLANIALLMEMICNRDAASHEDYASAELEKIIISSFDD